MDCQESNLGALFLAVQNNEENKKEDSFFS